LLVSAAFRKTGHPLHGKWSQLPRERNHNQKIADQVAFAKLQWRGKECDFRAEIDHLV
jgi:hypothetical protein